MELSPIIVFAYNRPELLRKTLTYLSENDLASDSTLFIYSDGPKTSAKETDFLKIKQVREVALEKKWCKEVIVVTAEYNKGLAASIVSGVSEIVNQYGKVIVVEDDVMLSKYFLQFMNEALVKYDKEDRILSIGSWNYFCPPEKLTQNFFLRYPDSIAWATFKRAWQLFNPDGARLLKLLAENGKLAKFNCNTRIKYFERMLLNQISGNIDSWAIRWTAVSVLYDKLNYFPKVSLSKHIGFVTDATHESESEDYNKAIVVSAVPIKVEEQPVKETRTAIKEWKRFIKTEIFRERSFVKLIQQKIKRHVLQGLRIIFGS